MLMGEAAGLGLEQSQVEVVDNLFVYRKGVNKGFISKLRYDIVGLLFCLFFIRQILVGIAHVRLGMLLVVGVVLILVCVVHVAWVHTPFLLI